jgi:hypothetical protein
MKVFSENQDPPGKLLKSLAKFACNKMSKSVAAPRVSGGDHG